MVVHGAGPGEPGADKLADAVAREIGLEVIPVRALWRIEGRKAGPRRNARMLREHPDAAFVIGFPLADSVGTIHCLRLAKARGFKLFRGRGSVWPEDL